MVEALALSTGKWKLMQNTVFRYVLCASYGGVLGENNYVRLANILARNSATA